MSNAPDRDEAENQSRKDVRVASDSAPLSGPDLVDQGQQELRFHVYFLLFRVFLAIMVIALIIIKIL